MNHEHPSNEEIPCLHLSQCNYVKVRFLNCPEKIGGDKSKIRISYPQNFTFSALSPVQVSSESKARARHNMKMHVNSAHAEKLNMK